MRRALAVVPLVACAVAMPSAAWAAPTTQVIQGDVLRLVSVADWDAAAGLLPGAPVQWDVAVSADAPDPGIVRIGVSARGNARLILDVALCTRPWDGATCPGGATTLRAGWSIPRDGGEVPLTEIADTETAHLRLAIALDPADGSGSTDVRVQAQGAGETVVVGPGGGLATTGPAPGTLWAVSAGAVLVAWGVVLSVVRRRRVGTDAGRGS
ncbi:MAG: hypothetical protein K0R99_3687 [Microbacterium sp.]|jgi:hypothetical protein|uniref:hypothetical protein n=1 Tax=Microbacterium sp. TaxID=51671 RepID=UPI0026100646|nr:hypothetical protein [Microbacterium sp.]MDF2562241.1 hypothetical protein [Microbacterium sp.]